ncbi:MAG: hypothetical protein WCT77_08935 [Bacteroidota bacterium]
MKIQTLLKFLIVKVLISGFLFSVPAKAQFNLNKLKEGVNRTELAFRNKTQNRLVDATTFAETALKMCDRLFSVLSNNNELVNLIKETENHDNKIDTSLSSDVYTSDYHKQNAEKIVFSKQPITIKNEKSSAITSDFNCNDLIYAMIYIKDTFKNITYDNSYAITQSINVDGKNVAECIFIMLPEKIEQTYLTSEIVVSREKAQTKGVKKYVKGLSQISPRPHKVEVSLRVNNKVIASGEFNFDCSDGTEPLEKMSNDFENSEFKSIVMPKAAKKDAKLEKEMLDALSDWKEKPLKAVITDDDWTIHRSVLGIIEYRTIGAGVAVKKPDGQCRLFWLSFKQDYNGKSYGKTQHYGVGDSMDMPCENVK